MIDSVNKYSKKTARLINNLTYGSTIILLPFNCIGMLLIGKNYHFLLNLFFVIYFSIVFIFARKLKAPEKSLFFHLAYGLVAFFVASITLNIMFYQQMLMYSVLFNSIIVYLLIFYSPYLLEKRHILILGLVWAVFLVIVFFFIQTPLKYNLYPVLVVSTFIVVISVYKFIRVFTTEIFGIEEYTKQIEAQSQELKKSNDENKKLLSIISHDLRSPMLTIQQLLGYMEKSPEKTTLEDIRTLESLSSDTISLIENILNWSLQQSNKLFITPDYWDITPIVDRVIALYSANAKLKGIELINEIPEYTVAYFDYQSVSAIIRNLINNALKFTYNEGIVTINIEKNAGNIKINVIDSGIGMEPAQISALLQHATAESLNGTDGESGSGLGINLCKQLISRNNGNLFIESQINKGTTVSFTLPLNEPAV